VRFIKGNALVAVKVSDTRRLTGKGCMDSKKILIAEDEIIVAEIIRQILIRNGYTVVAIVVTGAEAMRVAKAMEPDAVIMDILLKDSVSGVEAADYICKEIGAPILFLTANASSDIRKTITMACPYLVVTKPFLNQQILDALERLLSRD